MRIYLQLNANRIELAAFPETKCKELKVKYYTELLTALYNFPVVVIVLKLHVAKATLMLMAF